jgi:AraC-like DNA-binding protein
LRLKHPARLLAEAQQRTIEMVAYRCGFASHAAFSRAFKARYDMTPREYAADSARFLAQQMERPQGNDSTQ